MWSLKETFGLFQKENPHVKICLSKFCSLRPKNVLLESAMPRQVCLCQFHDNMKMLCDCLSKEISSFPSYSRSIVDHFVCDSNNEECMAGKCVKEALNSLESKIAFLLEHVFIKRKQAMFFEERIAKLKPDEAVVQVDFAENYTSQHQDEIQAAHWSQEQVTLFTVAIWAKDSANKTVCNSHVIVSDDHSHDKKSIAVFRDTVVNTFVRKSYPQVRKIDIFSDGPSSQFKNKYMASFYHTLQRKGLQIKWHFFAASHGKGVVDGLGGTVKRVVWCAVSTRKVPTVVGAEEFAKTAAKFCKSVNIKLYLKKDIDDSSSSLELDECFEQAKSIPGISKIHCIELTQRGELHCHLYSSEVSALHEIDQTNDGEDLSSATMVSDIERENSCYISGDDEGSDDGRDDMYSDDHDDDGDDDMPLCTDASSPAATTVTDKKKTNIDIHLGLPHDIRALFNDHCPEFQVHSCSSLLAQLIVSGGVDFEGDSLINTNDLKELDGNAPGDEDNWISNFVVDSYLQLVKTASAHIV